MYVMSSRSTKKFRMLLVKNCLLFIYSIVHQCKYNEAMWFAFYISIFLNFSVIWFHIAVPRQRLQVFPEAEIRGWDFWLRVPLEFLLVQDIKIYKFKCMVSPEILSFSKGNFILPTHYLLRENNNNLEKWFHI